jgi:hypothetical protein
MAYVAAVGSALLDRARGFPVGIRMGVGTAERAADE